MPRVLVAVLTATVATSVAAADTQRVVFTCPGGAALAVEFVTSDPSAPAIIHPPGGPAVTLPAQPSGSGFRYADDTHELRGKGREVTWTDRAGRSVACAARQDSRGG
jgi:membrane-bound inhibitor of C-type lysozyme